MEIIFKLTLTILEVFGVKYRICLFVGVNHNIYVFVGANHCRCIFLCKSYASFSIVTVV